MSDNESDNCNKTKTGQTLLFVQLLGKYEILLGGIPTKGPNTFKEKEKAAAAFCEEYNAKCEEKLTPRKVLTKIFNIRSRLKIKNVKNLTRSKKLKYTEAEKIFLEIWLGGDITIPEPSNKSKKSIEWGPRMSTPNRFEGVNTNTIDMESDDYFLQETATSMNNGETEEEDDILMDDDEDSDNEKYENMTLDQLKHIAMIAQIKLLKEQTAAAKIKKELNMYRMSLLKQENAPRT